MRGCLGYPAKYLLPYACPVSLRTNSRLLLKTVPTKPTFHTLWCENAGTIARTCAATGVGLHLVGPLGFEIDNSRLKRAGLDYWPYVTVKVHKSWQACSTIFLVKKHHGCIVRLTCMYRRLTSNTFLWNIVRACPAGSSVFHMHAPRHATLYRQWRLTELFDDA